MRKQDVISQELKRSIFSRDFSRVEANVLKLARSEDVGQAISLAERSGSVRVLVTVLRATNHQDSRDWDRLFIDYIGELSQDSTAARWFDGIEAFLWQSLKMAPKKESSPFVALADLEESQIADLRFLRDRTGGWPVWNEFDSAPKVIPLAEWEALQAT